DSVQTQTNDALGEVTLRMVIESLVPAIKLDHARLRRKVPDYNSVFGSDQWDDWPSEECKLLDRPSGQDKQSFCLLRRCQQNLQEFLGKGRCRWKVEQDWDRKGQGRRNLRFQPTLLIKGEKRQLGA